VAVLLAVSETSAWGWGSPKTLGLIAAGIFVLVLWGISELRSRGPLVDMRMMAIRGVWTTNLVALVLGIGMFSSFILIPQLAQLPASGGVGFGTSVIGAGLLMLPTSVVMLFVGVLAGKVERRFGSKPAVIAGSAFTMAGYVVLLAAHDSKTPIYIASGLLGIGIGLAFAAMANLIVQAVHRSQTGVATGMNTVGRTIGSAFGGQLAATFLATNLGSDGRPSIDGFNHGFLMGIIACALGVLVGLAIPSHLRARRAPVVEGGMA
jgi:MFS family permease